MMRFTPLHCPSCNALPRGTLETVSGVAHLIVGEDALAEYGGWTEIFWNDQETVRDTQGKVTLIGVCDHTWQAEMSCVEAAAAVEHRQPFRADAE